MNAPIPILPVAERRVVKAACPHDCPDTCAIDVTVENGVAVKIEGGDMPFTAGTLCTKVAKYLDRTYSPDRVTHPMRRVGAKGPGKGTWERISWDEALATIVERFKAVCAEDPQGVLPCDYAGTMGQVQWHSVGKRLFNRMGASQLDRTFCSSAGKAGFKISLGAVMGMDPERFEDARLIIIWGSNPIVSNLHLWTRIQEAKRRGAKLIAIDPYRSLTADKCHEHLAPLPGTDGALALGMMHVIIGEGLHDRDYVAKYTLGFEQLAERVKAFTPEKVAAITGLPAEKITALAREYAATKAAAIRLNYGMQRHSGGGMAARNIACLPALTGAWREAAGGVVIGTAGFYSINEAAVQRPDLMPTAPAPRTINISAIGNALLEADPPVRALYVYNTNPVAVAPDSQKVIAGFSRTDLFTVVHDVFITDTADYADIFLPATTQLEHYDVHTAYGHLYVMANNPAIAPVGEALPNSEVFRRIAAGMGYVEPCFRDSDEDICRQALDSKHPRMHGIEWDSLKAKGWKRLNVPDIYAPFAEGNFPTPSGKCEFFSDRLKARGQDGLPDYLPNYEPANPQAVYPLAMISPPARNFLNSSFVNVKSLRDMEGEPLLEIHPDDAAARGLQDGTMVRVFNARGSYDCKAQISTRAQPGMVVGLGVWWRKLGVKGTNVNELTSQNLTDMGRAPVFYDCAVQVEAQTV
jgi:anaerobic selenocysteine-containing dehydrogenase